MAVTGVRLFTSPTYFRLFQRLHFQRVSTILRYPTTETKSISRFVSSLNLRYNYLVHRDLNLSCVGRGIHDNQRQRSYSNGTSHKALSCWKCEAQTHNLNFCERCGSIQPTRKDINYFEVLGFPVKFDIDTKKLTQQFRRLQQLLHPDRFTQKSKEEQRYSDDQSSLVNKSYQTLLKPMPRGLYLLELHDVSLEEGEIHLDPVFLMEIMETNEALAETEDIEVIRKIGAENSRTLQTLISAAAEAFSEGDIHRAKTTLARIKYYANIDEKVSDFESNFF